MHAQSNTVGWKTSRAGRAAAALEGFFLRYRKHIWIVHLVFFFAFLAILLLPLVLPEPPQQASPFENLSLFVSYLLWGVWFPLVFLSVIATGRSWCGLMCPMGAASEWANAKGLRRPIPAWVRWEGMPIVSFVVITVLGQTLGVRDHPEAVLELFGGTLLLAIVVGFLWGRRRRRAWCRHLCPIGLLLGIFSRLGAVEFLQPKRHPGGDRWVDRGPCPTMIDIYRKEESRHCIECFRCVGKSRGALSLRLRRPGEEVERIRWYHANIVEVWFLFIGTGIALGGFLWLGLPFYQDLRMAVGTWFVSNGMLWIGEPGPWWLMSVHPERREVFVWLDFFLITGFMLGFAALMTAILGLTTAASAWLAQRFGGEGGFRRRFAELGYQYAPVAMISLVIGLGGELFDLLGYAVEDAGVVRAAKVGGLLLALAWSVWLGVAIARNQGLATGRALVTSLPGLVGNLLICALWGIAIFGTGIVA